MSKKVAVVTGYAGFIGCTFTRRLLEEGWYLYCIDKFTHVSNMLEADRLHKEYHPRMQWLQEDISKIDWLPECDVIFNLAAESDVDISTQNCSQFVRSNIDGVRNLLEIINNRILIRADKPLFFQVSTDEVYGDTTSGSFSESAILRPSNPYSATKAAADLLIQSWARTYGLDYIIARPSNNYGPHQYPEKLIPLAVKRLSRGKQIKLHNNGDPIRTWTHVEDTANAMITLYEKAERNKVYNISSEFEQTNYETVRKIINTYFMGNLKRDVPDLQDYLDLSYERPGQDVRYAISCDPLNKLGWKPEKKFDEELVKLVKQYKERWIW
jgi:dTDP-glucose 4,6-dehydratase